VTATGEFDGPQRYHRQQLLPWIGGPGQDRLRRAHALVVGCGALGSVIVDALARAGVGTLTIVDRDVVEVTNLQRQILFDEADVAAGTPKAEAARAKVARINRQVVVHAHVDDFGPGNAESILGDASVIIDGLDNFETRYLVNDLAVKHGRAYVYGGAVGTTGASMTILPPVAARAEGAIAWTDADATPCLRCVFPEAPPPGATPTCDTAGVLGPVVLMVAAHQAAQAIKLLTGNVAALDRKLLSIDAWTNEIRRFDLGRAAAACPCCGERRFEHLEGRAASATTSLCGRGAVQITPPRDGRRRTIDLAEAARRLAPHGSFTHNGFLVRGRFARERGTKGEPVELTLFPDGRAIIKGVTEPEEARSVYARYVGT
jgi:adenylyltransferase/sulfurtransferase